MASKFRPLTEEESASLALFVDTFGSGWKQAMRRLWTRDEATREPNELRLLALRESHGEGWLNSRPAAKPRFQTVDKTCECGSTMFLSEDDPLCAQCTEKLRAQRGGKHVPASVSPGDWPAMSAAHKERLILEHQLAVTARIAAERAEYDRKQSAPGPSRASVLGFHHLSRGAGGYWSARAAIAALPPSKKDDTK